VADLPPVNDRSIYCDFFDVFKHIMSCRRRVYSSNALWSCSLICRSHRKPGTAQKSALYVGAVEAFKESMLKNSD
jgi:hypothetical protein